MFGLLQIPPIGGHQKCALVLQGNCVVERIEKMMAGFNCEFGRSLHHAWLITHGKLHCRQHSNILKRCLWAHASKDGGSFNKPMQWLQDFEPTLDNRLHYPERLFGIRLTSWIREHPF